MAGITTWNKATAPAGTEAWGYAAQVKRALETAGLVFSVANLTERNGLAALVPAGVLPVPTLIWRADLLAYQTWDGTTWRMTTEAGNVITTDANWGYNGGLARNLTLSRTHVQLSLKMSRTGGNISLPSSYTNLGNFIPSGWYPVVGAFGTANIHTSGGVFRFQVVVNVSGTGDILMQPASGTQTLNTGDFFTLDMGWHY